MASHKEMKLSHNTRLTDMVALHGQLLADMGSRRNYEQLIHAGLWGGIGIGTGYAIESDVSFTGGRFWCLLFVYCVLLVCYSIWVTLISKRQQQQFFEARALRHVMYCDPSEIKCHESMKAYVIDERMYNWATGIQDPPAYLRILITAILLLGSAVLLNRLS
jgi:hypothetical protein